MWRSETVEKQPLNVKNEDQKQQKMDQNDMKLASISLTSAKSSIHGTLPLYMSYNFWYGSALTLGMERS